MPSRKTIATAIATLRRALPTNQHPVDDLDTGALWADLLDDVSDEALLAAVRAHLRHPERGRFWPTPADLLAHVPMSAPELDEAEDTWDLILEEIARGQYTFADILSVPQLNALHSIGGVWAIRRAEGPAAIGSLRKRWLEKVRASEAPRPAIAASRPALRLVDGREGEPARGGGMRKVLG